MTKTFKNILLEILNTEHFAEIFKLLAAVQKRISLFKYHFTTVFLYYTTKNIYLIITVLISVLFPIDGLPMTYLILFSFPVARNRRQCDIIAAILFYRFSVFYNMSSHTILYFIKYFYTHYIYIHINDFLLLQIFNSSQTEQK